MPRISVTYGFELADIHRLAELLGGALEIRLRRYQSPMIGAWYDSTDTRGQGAGLGIHIEANDPEPGYTAPTHPGAGALLVTIDVDAEGLDDVEDRLRRTGLTWRRVG